MSQRNPLNERNQADAKPGKTRKSAASAKPVKKAAASVYIKDPNAKPQKSFFDRFKKKDEPQLSKNQQKKIAKRAAEAEEELKANADERRAESREKKKGKWTLNDMEGSQAMESTEHLSKETQKAARKRYFNPGTNDYKKWRTLWWIIIIVGVCSLLPPVIMPDKFADNETTMLVFFGVGYGCLIAAVAVDAIKIRPIRKKARSQSIKGDKSKEATRARKEAKKEAAAKEAEKQAKRASRKRS